MNGINLIRVSLAVSQDGLSAAIPITVNANTTDERNATVQLMEIVTRHASSSSAALQTYIHTCSMGRWTPKSPDSIGMLETGQSARSMVSRLQKLKIFSPDRY